MIGTAQLDLIKAERKQWRKNSILNAIAIQKLSIELDTVRKQKDELQEKLNNINQSRYETFRDFFDDREKKMYEQQKKECELVLLNNR